MDFSDILGSLGKGAMSLLETPGVAPAAAGLISMFAFPAFAKGAAGRANARGAAARLFAPMIVNSLTRPYQMQEELLKSRLASGELTTTPWPGAKRLEEKYGRMPVYLNRTMGQIDPSLLQGKEILGQQLPVPYRMGELTPSTFEPPSPAQRLLGGLYDTQAARLALGEIAMKSQMEREKAMELRKLNSADIEAAQRLGIAEGYQPTFTAGGGKGLGVKYGPATTRPLSPAQQALEAIAAGTTIPGFTKEQTFATVPGQKPPVPRTFTYPKPGSPPVLTSERPPDQEGFTIESAGDKWLVRSNRRPGMEGLSPSQQNATFRLSDDYARDSKEFWRAQEAYGRVRASVNGPPAASSLAMIFSFMKLLDPTSVVREGEQASAENARGVPDAVRNLYNKVILGGKLTKNQMQEFAQQAKLLYDDYLKRQSLVQKSYSSRAAQWGIPSDLVVLDIEQYKEPSSLGQMELTPEEESAVGQ